MNDQRMYDILLSAHFSEKSSVAEQQTNTRVFKVARNASKREIKAAVEKIFQVNVVGLRTLNVKGKRKMTRKGPARTKSWKKAYIRVQEGQSIDLGSQE